MKQKQRVDKLNKWKNDLNIICKDFQDLLINRKIIWDNFLNNKNICYRNNIFCNLTATNYIYRNILGLSKLIDSDNRAVSLINLLNDIANNPKVINRSWYIKQYNKQNQDLAERDFDKFCKNHGDNNIDTDKITFDTCLLTQYLQKLKILRNKHIAHYDRHFKQKTNLVTYNGMHQIMNFIEEIIKKYLLLLNQQSPNSLLPTNQNLDRWQEIVKLSKK